MQAGDATHIQEFGPPDGSRRGPTKPFEQGAAHLLMHQLSEIARTFGACGDVIWGNGFNPIAIPTLFVCRGGDENPGFGICTGPVDRGRLSEIEGGAFCEIDQDRPMARRAEDVAFAELPLLWVNDQIVEAFKSREGEEVHVELDLADSEALVFDCSGRNYRPQSWEFARFVVHEAFHFHQLFDARWRIPLGYDPATPPSTHPDNRTRAEEETRLVEVAAMTHDDRQALRLVRRFVELRATRYERWPEIEMLERGTEQVEGSARYVENQYSRCNGRAGRLTMPPEALRHEKDWLDFGRLYRSGARMLELLDRFEVSWRKRLERGDDPYGIVCETLV
ncbi:MAG: hypothetical protein ACN4GZ_13895 [Acidimicrobiales bacterium]